MMAIGKSAPVALPLHEIEALIGDSRTLIAGDPYEGETRFRAIGRNSEGRPLFVVFTMREKNGELYVRPISARYMTQKRGAMKKPFPKIR